MSKISSYPTVSSPSTNDYLLGDQASGPTTSKFTIAGILGLISQSASGWITSPFSLSYGSNLGNKEFTITCTGDMTSILSAGMRLQTTRNTVPPTKCMSFTAASSQYATKASPTGIVFTAAFTPETWVYLNSYTGIEQILFTGRISNGWQLSINSSGQLRVLYGTGGTITDFVSYQSIPLKRWVHVAASVSSTASKTATLYINGAVVPSSSPNTAAAGLTQDALLRLGASNTPTLFLDGYLSETRLWSVAQTQSAIQANMAINLTGSETNLVALYQGNNNFTDSTANANTLTANGGAVASQASNPYNPVEYAEVVSVSYVNPTSTITVRAANNCNIPNMVLTSSNYSAVKSPFGWPGISYLFYVNVQSNQTGISSITDLNGFTYTLTIPDGGRDIRINGLCQFNSSTSDDYAFLYIYEGSTQFAQRSRNLRSGSVNEELTVTYEGFATAGSHTYKLRSSGNTSVALGATNTIPAYISVEISSQ